MCILLIIVNPFLPYLKGVTNPNHAYHSQVNVTKIGDKLKEELEKRVLVLLLIKQILQANLKKRVYRSQVLSRIKNSC